MKTLGLAVFTLFISQLGFAKTHNYQCFSYYWNGYDHEKGTMQLSVSLEKAEGKVQQQDDGFTDEVGGPRNLRYRSRGSMEMYKYGNLIVEKTLTAGGRPLRDGSYGGLARWEGQAEGGFFQYKFICKK